MEITLIIVAGIVLSVFSASLFEFLAKRKKKGNKELENKLNAIEKKVLALEDKIAEKDERIDQLENEMSFVNKLIEDKSRK